MSYLIAPNTAEYTDLQRSLPNKITSMAAADDVRRINKRYIKVRFVQVDASGRALIEGDRIVTKNKRVRVR